MQSQEARAFELQIIQKWFDFFKKRISNLKKKIIVADYTVLQKHVLLT